MLAGLATNYNDLAVLDNNRWHSRGLDQLHAFSVAYLKMVEVA